MNDRLLEHLSVMTKAMPVTCPACGWAGAMKPGRFTVPSCPVCEAPAKDMRFGRWQEPGAAITYHEEMPEGATEGRPEGRPEGRMEGAIPRARQEPCQK